LFFGGIISAGNPGGNLGASLEAQLAHHVLDVALDRSGRTEELVGNGSIRQSLSH
jgi:hypothetical protein